MDSVVLMVANPFPFTVGLNLEIGPKVTSNFLVGTFLPAPNHQMASDTHKLRAA